MYIWIDIHLVNYGGAWFRGKHLTRQTSPRLALTGVEVLENRFIVTGWIWNREELVTELCGARYFGEPKMIGGADHFGVVRPTNSNDPVHLKLLEFYLRKYSRSETPVCDPPPKFS